MDVIDWQTISERWKEVASVALRVSGTKDRFERQDGLPFFYLADTVWNVFTNASLEEWEEYLRFRGAQGFNAVQISVLPILHDRSDGGESVAPFVANADGTWNFEAPDPAYFEKAARMVKQAREHGFAPALVLLWASYVQGTWASAAQPAFAMPEEAIDGYVNAVVDACDGSDPIYLISGDTDFPSETTVNAYRRALAALKRRRPNALTAFHPKPGAMLPEPIANDPALDFYMYQQGHSPRAKAAEGAAAYYGLPVKRPIVNGEPVYEGIGYFKSYGRISAFDVRRAFWQSVLAGAKAGFTYGAHGVWSWHRAGQPFTSEALWGEPPDWRSALRYRGAQDVAFGKWLFETYGLFELEPAPDKVLLHGEEVAMGLTPDGRTAAIYLPHDMGARVDFDFTGYTLFLFELEGRNVIRPTASIRDGQTSFGIHGYNADALLIAVRERHSSSEHRGEATT